MCGLVGCLQVNNRLVSREEIDRALSTIRYRGPDDSGIHIDNPVGLGHVRLSILDLSKLGAQPMVSASGRHVIAYNGEVYNFAVLREELKASGVTLRSSGDTEAILEYMELFGVSRCLEVMEGMFAFALWDRQAKILTLARDRHGIKPLYYAYAPEGTLWFASEMKALLDFSRGPDHTSIDAAMLGLGCAYDQHTLLRGIDSVRAGETITFREGAPPEHRFFFRLPDFIDSKIYEKYDRCRPNEIIDEVGDALEESMRLCMISDSPVAVLASGGIDSSLIAALASKAHPDLKLFHANVVGASETPAAEALAKHLKCDLFSETITGQDTLDYTALVTYHYEMPLMYHTNAVPFYLVSRLAAKHGIKVVLTGEGSDEYFIGYAQMAIWPAIQRYRSLMARVQSVVHRIPGLGPIVWPNTSDSLALQLRSTLLRYELDERRTEAESAYSFISQWSKRLLSYMSLDMCEGNIPPLLHRNDRLGMAWGIESRFPFLGHKLAGFALNLPSQFKVRKTIRFNDRRHPFVIDKWCIRAYAERLLPRNLSRRGKYAFRAVAYNKLALTTEFFKDGFVQNHYGLGRRAVELMLEKSNVAWRSRLFMLEVWGRLFVRREQADVVGASVRSLVRAN